MKRPTTILAWALCVLVITLASAQLLASLSAPGFAPTPFDMVEIFGWGWAIPLVFSATGALIITRQPRNRVGWLLMLPALVNATSPDRFLAAPRSELTPGIWLVLWLSAWSWIPVIFPVLLLPLHFPTGRPPSPRWRWINWLAVGMWLFFLFFTAFAVDIGPLNYDWRLTNPIGFISQESFDGLVAAPWLAGLLVLTVGSVISLVVRYRRAGIMEREQIKWVLYAAVLLGFVYAFLALASTISGDEAMSAWRNLLLVLGILAFPVAVAIAILRYRLFDIDVIIRKTVLYGALTILLGLVYFGSVILLQLLFGSVIRAQSPLILVLSTLLIAALFNPLRRRLQGIIDRRFFRRKYDAQQVLARFARSARDETDLDNLSAELLAVLQETLQPQSVSLWTAVPEIDRGER